MLKHIRRILDFQSKYFTVCRKKTWTTIKETTRRMKSWERNMSFTGLTSWLALKNAVLELNMQNYMKLRWP